MRNLLTTDVLHRAIFSPAGAANRVMGRRCPKKKIGGRYVTLNNLSRIPDLALYVFQRKNCAENRPRTHATRHEFVALKIVVANRSV